MTNKQKVLRFLQEHYTTRRLKMLLDAAERGEVCWQLTTQCLLGRCFADLSYRQVKASFPDAYGAELAFLCLGGGWLPFVSNKLRMATFIPLVKMELRRRQGLQAQVAVAA